MVNIYWYKTQLYLLDSFNSSIILTLGRFDLLPKGQSFFLNWMLWNMRQVQPETLPKNSNFSFYLQNIKLKNNLPKTLQLKTLDFLQQTITMNENGPWQMIKDSVLFALSSGFSVSLFHLYLKKKSTRGILFCISSFFSRCIYHFVCYSRIVYIGNSVGHMIFF
jgi:hypothetical protein